MPSRIKNKARNERRAAQAKCGYGLRARTCECPVCDAYTRGYRAGQKSKNVPNSGHGKAAMDALYEDDPFMQDLLP